jgi:hypothetical protein
LGGNYEVDRPIERPKLNIGNKQRMTRSEAEQTLLIILRGISSMEHVFSRLKNRQVRDTTVTKEFNDLNTLCYSQGLLGTLRILKHTEFLDFFFYVLDSALEMGIDEVFPLYRTEIINGEAASGENPVIILLHFYRRREKLIVTRINNETNSSNTNEYNASNTIVRDATPEERFTILANRERDKNYFPQPFPNGVWEIDDKTSSTKTDEGPVVLRSKASQYVTVYEKRREGYDEVWVECGRQEDWGYNIHAGGNNWRSATEGCIRVEETTIRELARLYDAKGPHGKMYLSVDN